MRVSVDSSGSPFAVTASQRLQVGVTGDYFFTIGAPVLDAQALPGSDSTPGLRSSSIVWAGFNPGRRTLAAHMTLSPAAAAGSLPLRIEVHGDTTMFVNTTGVTVTAVTADADAAPLLAYLRQLRAAVARGQTPASGTATLRGPARVARVRVVAPLLLRGTVGGSRVDARLTGRLTVRARGPVAVAVTVADPRLAGAGALSGREALARATGDTLTVARVRQYRSFLGNPDPSGPSETRYVFRTAERPAPQVAARPVSHHRSWGVTLAVAAGVLLVLGAGLAAWARA